MARNGSGAMSIPNTLVSGATITAAGHNQNYSDIGSELTNSVALDGQSIMTGQFKAANGTVVAPGITFGADLDSGFYRIGADNIGFALGGALVVNYSATGVAITGTLSASGAGTIGGTLTVTGAITATAGFAGTVTTTGSIADFMAYEGISTEAGAAAGPIISAYRNSASPAASDTIGMYAFYGKDSGGNKTRYAYVAGFITDPTDGSEDANIFLSAMIGGVETVVLTSTGAQIQIPGSLAVAGGITAASETVTGALSGGTAAGAMLASQGDQETATVTNKLVAPGTQHFHPGHPKAWANFDQSGTHDIARAYNVTSITDAGVGQSQLNFAITFSDTTYGWSGSARDNDASGDAILAAKSSGSKTATVLQVIVVDSNSNAFDSGELTVIAWGDI